MMLLTPKSEAEFEHFQNMYLDKEDWVRLPEVKRAMIYFFLIKNAFNANPSNVFGVKATGNWGSDGLLETLFLASEKLQSASILNRDYMSVIRDYADNNTLVYLDPPYAVTIKGGDTYYQYTLPKEGHEELRNELFLMKAKFILSYDIHDFVTGLYCEDDMKTPRKGFFVYKTSEVFQSSINKHGKYVDEETYSTAFKAEYLITNFDISQQSPLFAGI
jgi:site-specific DNA-adenine methylase